MWLLFGVNLLDSIRLSRILDFPNWSSGLGILSKIGARFRIKSMRGKWDGEK